MSCNQQVARVHNYAGVVYRQLYSRKAIIMKTIPAINHELYDVIGN